MKKIVVALLVVILLCSVSLQEVDAKAPTTSVKKYKNNKNFTYVEIKGAKYKKINAKMLAYTKAEYKYQKVLKKLLAKDLKAGWAQKGMVYSSVISCKPKYKTTKKVSVLCETYTYGGGAHGEYKYKTFNALNGKEVNLKGAFSSTANYKNGLSGAKKYILNHPSNYPFASSSTKVTGRSFYWTSKGLKLVFEPYEIDSYSGGMKTVPVAKKYLK
ncbi:MAG: DUF3298 domain-containing protein [Kurthia sp.]|nr:DUF3298 domain-containing protein [Candidatus Kurthia equi]